MSPTIAILLASVLKAAIEILEKELSDDDKAKVTEEAEKLAANFTKKESETA